MIKINIKNVQQWHRLDNKENQWGRQLTTYKTQVTRPATRRVTNHKWRSQRPQTAPPNSSHKVSTFFQGNYIFWSYFGSQLVPVAPINCHLIPIFSVWYFIFFGSYFRWSPRSQEEIGDWWTSNMPTTVCLKGFHPLFCFWMNKLLFSIAILILIFGGHQARCVT